MRTNARDEFHRTPSRVGRGRRASVDFVVCFGCDGISFLFVYFVFFLECTRPATREATEAVFCPEAKKRGAYRVPLLN